MASQCHVQKQKPKYSRKTKSHWLIVGLVSKKLIFCVLGLLWLSVCVAEHIHHSAGVGELTM